MSWVGHEMVKETSGGQVSVTVDIIAILISCCYALRTSWIHVNSVSGHSNVQVRKQYHHPTLFQGAHELSRIRGRLPAHVHAHPKLLLLVILWQCVVSVQEHDDA